MDDYGIFQATVILKERVFSARDSIEVGTHCKVKIVHSNVPGAFCDLYTVETSGGIRIGEIASTKFRRA